MARPTTSPHVRSGAQKPAELRHSLVALALRQGHRILESCVDTPRSERVSRHVPWR